ncbi:hypothetical protein L2E82_03067 [Cichorium intybus]|uniref:Uncharacterized protein n=1 Tax=Cichorium intybus TaxID=13427 RepID=A0ACB9H4E5_CICIN|nr:hypothetical protein L2E82_03067 [Cichorium intybus]
MTYNLFQQQDHKLAKTRKNNKNKQEKIVYGFLPVDPASDVNVDPFLIESHHQSIMNKLIRRSGISDGDASLYQCTHGFDGLGEQPAFELDRAAASQSEMIS